MTFDLNFLSGKKTYLLAALGIIYAVSGFLTGNIEGQAALELIWAALTASTIRAGIAKGR